eukprot:TRINITY_DN2049_c1_g5_i1.p1 TRINITY_DN2049_c1_g5~~TRINITY_DN2049_c1_g5_i1.p1  ORF type:complete len:886 (-),score=345.80 TRINITY_DN2049_c1_g5_i1:33-2372(-)
MVLREVAPEKPVEAPAPAVPAPRPIMRAEAQMAMAPPMMGARAPMAPPMMMGAMAPPPPPPIRAHPPAQDVVREFAFKKKPNRKVGERTDFTETLYWNACISTDLNGSASVSFDLNDSVTSFRVWAEGFSSESHLGSSSTLVESREPFYLEPKIPLEVSGGDLIRLPVSLVNNLPQQIKGNLRFEIQGKGLSLAVPSLVDSEFTLKEEQRTRKIYDLKVENARESCMLTVKGDSPYAKDSISRPVEIVPSGFPFQMFGSGAIEPGKKDTHTFQVPKELLPGTMTTEIKLYCTPTGTLTDAIKSLNRSPCGCFEQTSMTSYPLTMAVQYLKSHDGTDDSLLESCLRNLAAGYEKLKGYECTTGGFDWFGSNPGHEALTAYGLMQFIDMSSVMSVDSAMIERTKKWLDGRRKKDGGFERNPLALDNFGGAPEEHTDAYITWALTEAGLDTKKDIDYVVKNCAEKKKDAYIWALTAICLYKSNRKEEATVWSRKLAELLKPDGSIADEETSITRSGGSSLIVEATALTILAWLNDDESFGMATSKANEYLVSQCKNGNFGSTQATLLALKAIIAFDKSRACPSAEGAFVVYINDKEEGRLALEKKPKGVLQVADLGSKISAGETKISVEMLDGSKLPYSITLDFFATRGDSSQECKTRLLAKLNDTKLKEGQNTEVQVVVENVSNESLPMTMAVIGVPGGLEPRIDKLKEMVKSGQIDFYEILGRRIALYWRFMAPQEKKNLLIDVLAAVPGTYTGPASSTYLYYTNEHVWWVEGLNVEITP